MPDSISMSCRHVIHNISNIYNLYTIYLRTTHTDIPYSSTPLLEKPARLELPGSQQPLTGKTMRCVPTRLATVPIAADLPAWFLFFIPIHSVFLLQFLPMFASFSLVYMDGIPLLFRFQTCYCICICYFLPPHSSPCHAR